MEQGKIRTLVLGSGASLGCDSVTWKQAATHYLADYKLAVVDFSTLDESAQLSVDDYNKIADQLFRITSTGSGEIVAIVGAPKAMVPLKLPPSQRRPAGGRVIQTPAPKPVRQIELLTSKFGVSFSVDRGRRRENMDRAWGEAYLHRLEEWQFHFERGGAHRCTRLLENAEGMILAARFSDGLTVVPAISSMSPNERADAIVRFLWSEAPTRPGAPEWVSRLPIPGITEVDNAVAEKRSLIAATTAEVEQLLRQRNELLEHAELIFATGETLETAVQRTLERLGGEILEKKYEDEDAVLLWRDAEYILEIKGLEGQLGLKQVRQLMHWMFGAEEKAGRPIKGVLVANTFRLQPLDGRRPAQYPQNVLAHAERIGQAIVSTVDLFDALCRVLAGQVSGETVLDAFVAGTGAVNPNVRRLAVVGEASSSGDAA